MVILGQVEWALQLIVGTVYRHSLKAHHLVVVLVVVMMKKLEPLTSFDVDFSIFPVIERSLFNLAEGHKVTTNTVHCVTEFGGHLFLEIF